MFPEDQTAYAVDFLNLAPTQLQRCQSIKYYIYQQYLFYAIILRNFVVQTCSVW